MGRSSMVAAAALLAGAVVAAGSTQVAVAARQPAGAVKSVGAVKAIAPVKVAARLVAVDRARRFGLQGRRVETYGAVPVDYNRDGRQDVWIGNHSDGAVLKRNPGRGRYVRVARTAWPTGMGRGHIDRHDCDWADVDRNGLPDAYCSTGRMRVNVVKRGRDNELWLQTSRGRFREVGTRWGVGDLCGRGRDVEFLNVNGDRFPDLFLGNEQPRDDPADPCNQPGNRLPNEGSKIFINRHGTGFRYAPHAGRFALAVGNRCAVALDFNHDGWQDLLACRDRGESARLYRNERGRLVDVTARHRLAEPVDDAVVADLDRDGDNDIVTASADGFGYHPFRGGSFGPRVPLGNLLGGGTGGSVAVGDVDGDGDQDVYGVGWARTLGNPDDVLLINQAMTFTPLRVPSAGGSGDEAVAVRPRAAGTRTLFLVTNGNVFGHENATFRPGLNQLITVVRR